MPEFAKFIEKRVDRTKVRELSVTHARSCPSDGDVRKIGSVRSYHQFFIDGDGTARGRVYSDLGGPGQQLAIKTEQRIVHEKRSAVIDFEREAMASRVLWEDKQGPLPTGNRHPSWVRATVDGEAVFGLVSCERFVCKSAKESPFHKTGMLW